MNRRNATLTGLALGIAGVLLARRWAHKYDFRNRAVLITGGSRGLGLELARELLESGAKVALIARDRAELIRVRGEFRPYGTRARFFICDVTNESDVARVVPEIVDAFGKLDVVINNAGIIQVSPLAHVTRADYDHAMATHFFGPLAVIDAALPYLRSGGGGRIINISSIGGKVAVPHLLPYSASKFALCGLSEGLRAELRRENIIVTTVCPGLMRTGSPPNVLVKGQHEKEYAWFAIADSLPGLAMQSRRAARKILSASAFGRAQLVLGWPAKAAVLFHDLMPETFSNTMALTNRFLPDATNEAGDAPRRGYQSESQTTRRFVTADSRRASRRNNEVSA